MNRIIFDKRPCYSKRKISFSRNKGKNDKIKVCLVEVDYGDCFGDNPGRIEKAFFSYRKASEWLIEEGFEPLFSNDDLVFVLEGEHCSFASIIEMEVIE